VRESQFMKISIVTASFNQGRFIDKCLNSVRAQQGDFSVEHIILDNCSTDTTGGSLANYQADCGTVDIQVLVEPDAGQTEAINKGFNLAKGDVVCWLNTDEWYEDGALAKVVDFFARHPEVDVLFGNCDFVDSDLKFMRHRREFFYSESMLIYYGCFIPSCSTFIRRRVIDAGVILDPEFKVNMDYDWYVRIAKAGYRFAHLPFTPASFTWHDNNISSIFAESRGIESRLVKDRYSGIPGPYWLRTLIYRVMRYFWLAVRVTRRFAG
jgi:glycosyltransferase involved in cell wall biosynthesis